MKNLSRVVFSALLAVTLCSAAIPQQAVPPPPKPPDEAPSLTVTLNFIQEKMNKENKTDFAETCTGCALKGVTLRYHEEISGVIAEPAACTLRTSTTKVYETDLQDTDLVPGMYWEAGKQMTGVDAHFRTVLTTTFSLKNIEKIQVEGRQDLENRQSEQQGRPEVIVSVAPPVFLLELTSSKEPFNFHRVSSSGKRPPQESTVTGTIAQYTFADEEIANRVAKAMVHAVELCGGGSKEPF